MFPIQALPWAWLLLAWSPHPSLLGARERMARQTLLPTKPLNSRQRSLNRRNYTASRKPITPMWMLKFPAPPTSQTTAAFHLIRGGWWVYFLLDSSHSPTSVLLTFTHQSWSQVGVSLHKLLWHKGPSAPLLLSISDFGVEKEPVKPKSAARTCILGWNRMLLDMTNRKFQPNSYKQWGKCIISPNKAWKRREALGTVNFTF